MKLIQKICFALLIMSLFSCAKKGLEDDDYAVYKNKSAKELFTAAEKDLSRKEYTSAIKQFEALETMYPFNDYAERAELDLIYAYYAKEDYASTAAAAERFIHLYPRAARVDYAYYMKGLANFQQLRGPLAQVLPMDASWRDPGTQAQAYSDFATFIEKFPESRYKPNALQRMIYLRNQLAQHELNVANYYYERRMYVACANRASYLIRTYPQAPSAPAALIVLYQANKAMGLEKAAADAQRVYEATYHRSMVNPG